MQVSQSPTEQLPTRYIRTINIPWDWKPVHRKVSEKTKLQISQTGKRRSSCIVQIVDWHDCLAKQFHYIRIINIPNFRSCSQQAFVDAQHHREWSSRWTCDKMVTHSPVCKQASLLQNGYQSDTQGLSTRTCPDTRNQFTEQWKDKIAEIPDWPRK